MAGANRSPASAACLAILLAGCVTDTIDSALEQEAVVLSQGTVVVPLAGGSTPAGEDERLLRDLYEGVLERMQGAYLERDLPGLRALLASYQRNQAPDWAREHMDRYAALVEGLAFELHCLDKARLAWPPVLPPLGAPLPLRLEIPGMTGSGVRLGGEGSAEPTTFGVRFEVEERDAYGGSRTQESSDSFRLPRTLELTEGSPVTVPLELRIDAGQSVMRTVRVWVELLPGYVQVNGDRTPVRRLALDSTELVLYPENVQVVREKPLLTMREAMRLGDPPHFPHVFLAAHFLPEDQKEQGIALLMQWVRLGREDQQRVAMASLKEISGEDYAVGDRERWLRWWQERAGGERR